jgi:hypothetical protein
MKKRKKGMHPAVAVGLFLVCAGVAAYQFLGMRTAPPTAAAGGDTPVADEVQDAPGGDPVAVVWSDLLAKHGSFAKDSNVQLAFVVAEEAAAAPAGEVTATRGSGWLGLDPPSLKLGVVMLAGAARRAVLGGKVVGVGDTVVDGEVSAIEPGKVVLAWRSRTLTYQLDSDVPVEFRAEAARREAERQAAQQAASGEATPAAEDDVADVSPAEALERVRAEAAKAGAGGAQGTSPEQKSKSKSKSKSKPQAKSKSPDKEAGK